jgi:regulator of replication initiation timing
MAVTVDDVHRAADKLNAEGVKPTYDAIRASLGKASYSIIRDGLKTWTAKAADAGPLDPAPEEVVQSALSFGSHVWGTALAFANRQTDERLVQVQAELNHTIGDLQSVITSADQSAVENEQLKVEVESLKATLGKCRNTLAAREKDLIASKSEVETLRRTIDQFSQSLLNSGRSVPASVGA